MALYTRMLARSCSLLSVPGLSRTRLRNLGKQPCEHTKRQKKVAGWTEGKNRQRETSETKGERERERLLKGNRSALVVVVSDATRAPCAATLWSEKKQEKK